MAKQKNVSVQAARKRRPQQTRQTQRPQNRPVSRQKVPAPRPQMQVQVNQGQRMRPQKQNITQRPLAQGRTGRARSLHLRKIVRRKERNARFVKIFGLFLSFFCGIFSLTTFFQVSEIRIEGMSRYTTAEVLQTFGVEEGDNLFFCDSWRGKNRLLKEYHYFENVTIERDLPNTMVIEVVESKPIAVVQGTTGSWFVLDKNGRVLDKTDQTGAKDIAEVIGLRTQGAEPGQMLPAESPEALNALKAVTRALDAAGMSGKATLYNVQDLDSIWFRYENRFAVCVGDTQNMEHKMALLYALVTGEQFTPSDKGTINLALGDRAITNTSLTAAEVEQTVRGQSKIERIADPQILEKKESEEDSGQSEQENQE